MKNRKNARFSFIGALLFFCTIALSVTVSFLVFGLVNEKTNGNKRTIAIVLFLVVLFLTVLFTLCDVIRRRIMVDRPVEEILNATEKIARGDFSVRIHRAKRSYDKYDSYDAITDNINALAEELGQLETLKSNFIASISHELKTPLSVIQNYGKALQTQGLEEETRTKYLQTLLSATEKLNALVTNILKLNKLENTGLLPEKRLFRLDEQLAEVAVGMETPLEQKELSLDCDLEECSIISSPELLEIVWNNLLSNGIKFTDTGGHLRIRLQVIGKNVAVTFQDDGCGISPETGKHIFDKFYQGDTSRSAEGNGLGLALVKKVIDTLGGEIAVQSELGKGSVFTITLKGVVHER